MADYRSDMIAYWLLFLVFAVGAFWSALKRPALVAHPEAAGSADARPKPTTGKALGIAALMATLLIGLRFEVGTDWVSYIRIFKFTALVDPWTAMHRIDPGYALLNWSATRANLGIWAVNLACATMFMFGVVRFARIQPNPWLTIAVAVPYLIIVVGMGYTRQSVAIGLFLAGLAALSGGSFTRFVLWVLVGGFFHRSAVLLIPIIAIGYSRNRFQAIMIGLAGCVAGYYLLNSGQGFEHFQRQYVNRVYQAQGVGIRLAMNLLPALIYLGFSRRFTNDELERVTWRNFAILAILSFATWPFIESNVGLDRISLYIIPLQLFVLGRLPKAFRGSAGQSSIALTMVIAYSAAAQFVWLNYSNNAPNWVPYHLYSFD